MEEIYYVDFYKEEKHRRMICYSMESAIRLKLNLMRLGYSPRIIRVVKKKENKKGE